MNHTHGGVTIVRVGGAGSRPDGVGAAASRSELNLGGGAHKELGIYQPNTGQGTSATKFGNKYQKHGDTSRSTSRLLTASNRSMPRLNARKLVVVYFGTEMVGDSSGSRSMVGGVENNNNNNSY